MFSHLQGQITEKCTIDMLKIKREMKQIERSKQGLYLTQKNRQEQNASREKNGIVQGKIIGITKIRYCKTFALLKNLHTLTADQILDQLESQNRKEVISIIQSLIQILEESKNKCEIIECLFDINILSILLTHIQTEHQTLQHYALYLLSILLSEQTDLFNQSFSQKNGTQILERVIHSMTQVDNIKQILYCFGNTPSHKLSKSFLEQTIPNILYRLVDDKSTTSEILETYSWFLNSCLDLEPLLYYQFQFNLITLNQPELTSEVISNCLMYPNTIVDEKLINLVTSENLLNKLEQDPHNYLNYSQVIGFLQKLIEICPQIYEVQQKSYEFYLEGGLTSSKDIICQEAIKLMTSIIIHSRNLDILSKHFKPFLKIMEYRRSLQLGCVKFLKLLFCIKQELDKQQFNLYLTILQEADISKILLQILRDNLDHPDKFVELILFFFQVDHQLATQFKKSLGLMKTLKQIANQKNDQSLCLQLDILSKIY